MTSKQSFRLIGGCAAGALLITQFFQPNRPAPAIEKPGAGYAAIAPDSQVVALLKRSCGDCHSNDTVWPWYARISPVSYLVVRDVTRGRRHLNFSAVASLSDHQMGEIYDVINLREMPPKAYTFMHPEAKLSPADSDLLKKWALGELPAEK